MIAPAPAPAAASIDSQPPAGRCRHTTAVLLRMLLIAPLALLTHCAGKGYKAANYSPEKLATPAHNMSQRDYPFDANGNYRKEWVKSGSTRPGSANVGRKKSTTTVASNTKPAPRPATTGSRSNSRPSTTSSAPRTITPPRTTVPTSTSASTYRPPAPKPAAKPKPKPAPARYHTVTPKQTLWAISQKYGISVAALQRANGLSGTLIRPGQSLRIP
jgi:LysM repeat protein